MPDLSRAIDIALVLLGGAGGAFLVWWLDGRRVAARERRELIGALELVSLELSGNVAMADAWARPTTSEFAPIELRGEAWSAHQTTLARSLPRDIIGHLGAGYGLARMLMNNVEVARRKGQNAGANDIALATRTRDYQNANLREVQTFMRTKLGIRFTIEPEGPGGAHVTRGNRPP
ncbi:MAG TPA: hypothetical protein VGR87_09915 [Candidatus Limnocylindria bacterium]|jgi:hypothetical protein|nr:hypothetical protein [Candidatus Limnocylindria bacterium]